MLFKVFFAKAKIGIAQMLITNQTQELMKLLKSTLILFFTLAFFSTQAQDISNHAFGLRLGESDGFGAALSYQKSIGRYNRLELDLGYQDSREFNAAKLTALFQSVHEIAANFNWYYGFGGGVGTADFAPVFLVGNPETPVEREGGLFALVAGNVGVEVNFDFPILLSFDIKPELGVYGVENFDNKFNFDLGIGIRYQF